MSPRSKNEIKEAGERPIIYSNHPGYLLRRAQQRCREIHTEVCRDLDVTTMQASAIHTLSDMGAITQATLGKAIGMEPPNVHGLIRRMVSKELISLTPNKQDARANIVELTRKGKGLATKLAKRSKQVSERFLTPLDKKEQKVLRELLIRLIDTPCE